MTFHCNPDESCGQDENRETRWPHSSAGAPTYFAQDAVFAKDGWAPTESNCLECGSRVYTNSRTLKSLCVIDLRKEYE